MTAEIRLPEFATPLDSTKVYIIAVTGWSSANIAGFQEALKAAGIHALVVRSYAPGDIRILQTEEVTRG